MHSCTNQDETETPEIFLVDNFNLLLFFHSQTSEILGGISEEVLVKIPEQKILVEK